MVGYATPDGGLYLADDGSVRYESLSGEVSWSLENRHCAGVVDWEAERHTPCAVSSAPYCDDHAEGRYNPATSQATHAVYLAAFAPRQFKVGITKRDRVERRLREQGADRGVVIATVADGAFARLVEESVEVIAADLLGIELTQRVRTREKMATLHRSVDDSAFDRLVDAVTTFSWGDCSERDRAQVWSRLVERFDWLGRRVDESTLATMLDDLDASDRYAFDYGIDLTDQPIPETVLSGTVRGVQGRVLVLDRAGTTYGVDLRDTVGYELTTDDEKRELQSSLGAFGGT